MVTERYLKVKKEFIKKGFSFEECEIDETPKFNSSIKGSKEYKGCVGIAIFDNKEGALFHYSYFPAGIKKDLENYLNNLNKKNLKAKIVLYDGIFANTEKEILKDLFDRRNIQSEFLMTKDECRDIVFYPEKGLMEIFLSNGEQISL